jgi:hypothetical protein
MGNNRAHKSSPVEIFLIQILIPSAILISF